MKNSFVARQLQTAQVWTVAVFVQVQPIKIPHYNEKTIIKMYLTLNNKFFKHDVII